MRFTGTEALKWQVAFVDAFEAMAERLAADRDIKIETPEEFLARAVLQANKTLAETQKRPRISEPKAAVADIGIRELGGDQAQRLPGDRRSDRDRYRRRLMAGNQIGSSFRRMAAARV